MIEDTYRTTLVVPAAHPSLPGHFPAEPIVPGVLLLEQVATALRDWRGQRVASISEAKFMLPLRPDERAEMELRDSGGGEGRSRIRFVIQRDGDVLARGLVLGETTGESAA